MISMLNNLRREANAPSHRPGNWKMFINLSRRSVVIVCLTYVLTISCAVGYHFLFGTYIATAVVGPPSEASGHDISKLGGLQSILANSGLPLSGGANLNPDFEQFLYFLNSNTMARLMLREKPDMVRHLLPHYQHLPTAGKLARYLNSHLLVNRIANTSFIKITFSDSDSGFSQAFLEQYFRIADSEVRHKNQSTYAAQKLFLEQQLKIVDNRDVQLALSNILIEVQRNLMMINSNSEYAFQLIDAPYSDALSGKSPGLALMGIVGIVLGTLFLVAGFWIRAQFWGFQ